MLLSPDTTPALLYALMLVSGFNVFYKLGGVIGERVSIYIRANLSFQKLVKEQGIFEAQRILDRRKLEIEIEKRAIETERRKIEVATTENQKI